MGGWWESRQLHWSHRLHFCSTSHRLIHHWIHNQSLESTGAERSPIPPTDPINLVCFMCLGPGQTGSTPPHVTLYHCKWESAIFCTWSWSFCFVVVLNKRLKWTRVDRRGKTDGSEWQDSKMSIFKRCLSVKVWYDVFFFPPHLSFGSRFQVTDTVSQSLCGQAELVMLLLESGHALKHHLIVLSEEQGQNK